MADRPQTPAVLPADSLVSLKSILCTEELNRRPFRPADYETENRALVALAQALADSPRTILQKLADTILEVFQADSAGLSLLTEDGQKFYWPAIAGQWKPHAGGGTPRHFGPCGDVLDKNAPLLFRRFERRYPYLLQATPPAEEALLIPFYVHGKAIGTIWAMAHDDRRRFDAEDLRQLESLGRFASAAYQAAERTRVQDSRRAALNVMEDAVQARQLVEDLNRQLGDEITERKRTEVLLQGQKEALEMVAGATPVGDVLTFLARAVESQSPHAMMAAIHLLNPEGTHFASTAAPSLPAAYREATEGLAIDSRSGPCCDAVLSGEPVVVPDVAHDPRFPRFAEFALPIGIHAGWSTPIFSSGGKVVGTFAIYYGEPREPSPQDQQLLGIVTRTVALAIERTQTEETLRESEKRYRTLFDSIDEGFCIIEKVEGEAGAPLDFRYLEANPWFAAHAGVDGVVGQTIRSAFPGEPEEWYLTYDAIVRTGEPIRFERGLVSHGRVLELYAFRVDDDTHRRVAVIFKDITARKQVEDARARLAAIVESSDEAIISKDLNGLITSWNHGAERLFGHTAQEAVGQPVTLLIPAERFDEEAGILERIRRGEVVERYETVRRRKDGARFDALVTVSPIRDDQGKVVGASKVARDISEARQAAEALRQSEERYRSLTQAITSVIWTTDSDGRFIVEQPSWSEYTGQTWEELRDFGWANAIHPDDRDRVQELWETARAARSHYKSDGRLWHAASGAYRYFEARGVPVLNAEGSVREWVGQCLDIEERRRSEQALSEADHRKDEFLAMLAHELRNPLAPIRNSLEIMRRANVAAASSSRMLAAPGHETDMPRLDASHSMDSAMDMLDRQVGQMVRLVEDLLDASRISRGKMELRSQRVELSSAVHHAVEAARPLCDSMGHDLTVTLPPDPVYLDADPTRLAQIVGNLLSNACKFTDRGGRIWLTVERGEASEVVIRVRDTGIGIAADQLPRVFNLFTQVDTSLERTKTGLGIGLTLVRTLSQMHGGDVEVSSAGVGQGSEFVVRLPIVVETPERARPPMTPEPAVITALRILVVDDNQDAAESLAVLLQFRGHETHMAHDGLEAVEAAARLQPDVVLLDIGLPSLNGYEVARRIREQQNDKAPILVALTGWGQDEDRRRSKEAGFDAHIVKPVDDRAVMKLLVELGAGD